MRAELGINTNYFLVVVNSLNVAEKDEYHMHNHYVREGHKYLSCTYLYATKETKTCIEFAKRKSGHVLVYPGEILQPFVDISDDLILPMDEHNWLQAQK